MSEGTVPEVRKYRRVPLEQRAFLYEGGCEVPDEIRPHVIRFSASGNGFFIRTIDGNEVFIPADTYAVQDVEGHWYPCHRRVFEGTFERV